MTKPARHNGSKRKAAPALGAAFALSFLLAAGLLPMGPLGFAAAAEDGAAPVEQPSADAADGVVAVLPPSSGQQPSDQKPSDQAPSDQEPSAQQPSVVPDESGSSAVPVVPQHERAWTIGAQDAASVVAELWPDGTFVVFGEGDTAAFGHVEQPDGTLVPAAPWLVAGYADDIRRVVFADGVAPANLAGWFEGCSNLEEVASIPDGVQDLSRTFFDCPLLTDLPDGFALAPDVEAASCFGFSELPETPLETAYRGTDEGVLAYGWAADGRVLVDPDDPAPAPDDAEGVPDAADGESEVPPADDTADAADEAGIADEDAGDPSASEAEAVPDAAEADPPAPVPAVEPDVQQDQQVNITVPSSVSMLLGAEGKNTALVSVKVANRSDRPVAIVGARLKRAGQELPGGSWSLTTESGATTFVQDARFTPLGLETTFDRPVLLAAGDAGTTLAWHGTFTDYGTKQLFDAVAAAGDEGFAYGSMIWIVAAG